MKKNGLFLQKGKIRKTLFMLRLSFYMVLLGCMGVVAAGNAQTKVDMSLSETTLLEVIWELQKKTGCTFVYSTSDVESVMLSDVQVNQKDVREVLNDYLGGTDLTYAVHDDVVVIRKEMQVQQAPGDLVISGVVVDEEGETLPGVSIRIKGTSSGVSTDIDGRFTMRIPASNSAELVFSFVGMANQEMRVTASTDNLRVVMKGDSQQLEEVIVTGYGTIKKSAYAGSASVIKADKMEDVPVTSFTDLLAGNASGVSVTSASGQPGSTAAVRIRGVGSFNASKSPLYVIDGVPVMSGDLGASNSSNTSGLDIMSTISTSDIESISVIKDAAAAALYGSRAANGVIIITTKSGKKGKPVFSLKADMGYTDFAMDYRKIMGGAERREVLWEGLYNRQIIAGESESKANKYAEDNIDKYAPEPWSGYTNWDKVLFQKGKFQNYEFSAAGGGDNLSYYSSISFTDQEGVARKSSGLKRVSARTNVDYGITEKLKLGIKTLFSSVEQDIFSEGTSYTSPFYSSRNAVVPSDPVYNEDGSWNRSFIRNSDRNPKLAMEYNYKTQELTRAFNTMYAQYSILEDLRFKSTFSYDYNLSKYDAWDDPRTSDGKSSNGSRTKRMVEYKKMVWSNVVSYDKTIQEKHNLDALVGFDIESYDRDYLSGNGKSFINPDMESISNAAEPTSVGGYESQWRLASFISRLNYDYDHKYYFGLSLRTDGSSRLHSDKRWGTFWSVSGAWRILQEDFAADWKGTLSDLRLRASYGTNGTLPSNYYGYQGLTSLGSSYMDNPGMLLYQIQNYDLKWEKNYNLNIGVDVGFFERINLTIEYFNRKTKDLLVDFPISGTTGYTKYLSNVGEVRNQGIEVDINTTNISTKNFTWTTNFNIGHVKNEVLKLDGKTDQIPNGNLIHKVGKQYYTFYVVEFAGIDPADGMPTFYTNTLQEDGKRSKEITKTYAEAERIPYKGYEPKVSGGLTNSLKYKWFDLNFMFTYQFGGYGYDNWAQKTEHGGADMKANIPTYYRNRWKKPGDKKKYERFIEGNKTSMGDYATSRRIHSSDYIRLKNITLGVTIPKEWIKRAGLNNARIYCAGSNLWTWAKYDYYDPEGIGSNGIASWEGPPLKTITFGLDVKF